MAGQDFESRVLAELRELKDRIAKLEDRTDSIARAFSRLRHQGRRVWLRPPLWTFEQYVPRPLNFGSPRPDEKKIPADPPSIAIVTPSFNHAEYLSATVDSVLAQHYPRLSYLVQDGGSSDGSIDILRSYGPRLIWRSGRDDGQAQAINHAFAACEGEVMAYLNSDDLLLPGTLAYVAGVFHNRPEIDVIYGNRVFVDRDGLDIGRAVLPRHDAKALYWADYVPQETLFWRRRVWEAVGPFDESFHYALDWDFILRAQHAGFKFRRVPRFLACFRVHDQQKTAVNYDQGREEMQRLRSRYLGHEPTHAEVMRKMMPYLVRQLAVHWAYRCGILRI
jgi:glycosyltransferase involved in cell wall biosynthesis